MDSKIKVNVKFFAYARELVGEKNIVVEVERGISIKEFIDTIIYDYPDLENIREQLIIAVNKTTVRPDKIVKDGDEVALLPPVAGG